MFPTKLGFLAKAMTEEEKETVNMDCRLFILKYQKLATKFNERTGEDQEWVLTNSASGKGVIPYEMITRFDS